MKEVPHDSMQRSSLHMSDVRVTRAVFFGDGSTYVYHMPRHKRLVGNVQPDQVFRPDPCEFLCKIPGAWKASKPLVQLKLPGFSFGCLICAEAVASRVLSASGGL
eukprot:6256684-Amphidinium_carterae.1